MVDHARIKIKRRTRKRRRKWSLNRQREINSRCSFSLVSDRNAGKKRNGKRHRCARVSERKRAEETRERELRERENEREPDTRSPGTVEKRKPFHAKKAATEQPKRRWKEENNINMRFVYRTHSKPTHVHTHIHAHDTRRNTKERPKKMNLSIILPSNELTRGWSLDL